MADRVQAPGRKNATEGGLHEAMPRAYADCIAAGAALEVFMPGFSLKQRHSLIAATIVLVSLSAGTVLAQTTPGTGTGTPAATPPAATTTPPAAAATTTAPPAAAKEAATTEPANAKKKKAAKKKMTRQQEIDKSIDSGTVPARYRSSIPKQYHQHIPFAKQ